ncbi:MAG TPA: hypothetical protein VEW90_04395 [Gaiellaceae bacterium]|nr:hypothetical protein [Gaiellaceae bacterium]
MRRPAVKDIAIVLALSWLARALFVAAIGDAHSLDVGYWEAVLQAQDEGVNPYLTGVLNWPPLWLVVIVTVDFLAGLVEMSFWSALRVYLVLVESLLVVTLYLTLVRAGAERFAVRRALVAGIALNPVAIILVCQHGNSDVQVGFLVTLAVAALISHWRSRDAVLWLCGCLLVGLAILAKTAPLVLAPILAPGARAATRVGRTLGAVLLLGPAALGVAVIAALVPVAVWDHVIGYRSTRGYFGLSGMVSELGRVDARLTVVTAIALALGGLLALLWRRWSRDGAISPERRFALAAAAVVVVALWIPEVFDRLTGFDARARYDTAFTLAVVLLVAWLAVRLWRLELLGPAEVFLLVAVIFMTIVAFGPGYGAHYAYWFIPALVGTYVLLDDRWRRLLRIAWIVAAVTYGVEYAFIPFLGAYAAAILGEGGWVADVSEYVSEPWRLVVFRIPLFVVYLVVIAEGVGRLGWIRERSSGGSGGQTSPPAASRVASGPGRA